MKHDANARAQVDREEELGPPLVHVDEDKGLTVHMSADARVLAVAFGKLVRIFSMPEAESLVEFLHPAHVNSVSFDATASRVATACEDNHAYVYDLSSGRMLHNFKHTSVVHDVEFDANHDKFDT